jgi:enoyl-CoA hydratase
VLRRAFDAVAAVPRVTIAAVAGYALGGGCELAMACDLRLVSEKAVFGQPEILLGIIPGAGGTQRLPRLVGTSRAKELILSGRQVRADEALRIGLADRVVAPESLFDEAVAWAATFAQGPFAAQALAKHAIEAGLDLPLAAGLDLELEDFIAAFRTDDSTIGIKSFLAEGPGKAVFTGR